MIEMKSQPLVALVVPVHNNREETREFLESLRQLSYPNYRVIVIDDGSTDGTEEMIKQEFPEVILLKGDGNLWSSGAINKGIEKGIEIGANYMLIVDNDTVVHPEFVSALVDTAERNPGFIVAPKVYHYNDPKRIQSAGWKMTRLKLGYAAIGRNEIDRGQYDSQRDIDCVTMGTFVNTAVIKDIGMMDAQNLPLYGADQDFVLRARKRGYRITAGKDIPEMASFPSRLKYLVTNIRSHSCWHVQRTMIFRHYPKYLILPKLVMYLLSVVKKTLRHSTT